MCLVIILSDKFSYCWRVHSLGAFIRMCLVNDHHSIFALCKYISVHGHGSQLWYITKNMVESDKTFAFLGVWVSLRCVLTTDYKLKKFLSITSDKTKLQKMICSWLTRTSNTCYFILIFCLPNSSANVSGSNKNLNFKEEIFRKSTTFQAHYRANQISIIHLDKRQSRCIT